MAELVTRPNEQGEGDLRIGDGSQERPPQVRRRRGRVRRRMTEAAWGLFFIAPAGLGLVIFYLWPVLRTLYFSFTSWGPFGGHTWTGLENYATLLHDSDIRTAVLNTLLYVAIGLLSVPLGIVFAILINRPGLHGVAVYRTLYFLPVVTMPAAIGIMWGSLYNGDYGLLNSLLARLGITGLHWTSDPRTALFAVALVSLWSALGYNIIIFSAGLQGIPRQYFEASAIAGAGWVRQTMAITLPLLTPSIFFVTVISVINSFQVFDVIYVMVGPQNPALQSAMSIVYLFYQSAFMENDRGYAAAIAFVLLLLIALFTAVQFKLQNRWVHYD